MSDNVTVIAICDVPHTYEPGVCIACERDALRADAERYRWLRDQSWNDDTLCVVRFPKDRVKLGTDCPSGSRLDDAIDAALNRNADQPGAQPTRAVKCDQCGKYGDWHFGWGGGVGGDPSSSFSFTFCSMECTNEFQTRHGTPHP